MLKWGQFWQKSARMRLGFRADSLIAAGAAGGLFAKMLGQGAAVLFPKHMRRLPMQHPISTAFACGLIVALLGWMVNGATYGTGYEQTSALLNGQTPISPWFGIANGRRRSHPILPPVQPAPFLPSGGQALSQGSVDG